MTMETADEVLDAKTLSTDLVALTPLLKIKAGLADLAAEAKPFDVSTTAGDKAARAFRAKCVSLRSGLDEAYETVNRPMLNTQRAARALLAELKTSILALEGPADAAIKVAEATKEKLRQERLEKEAARIAEIRRRIRNLFMTRPAEAMGRTSAWIRDVVIEVEATPVDDSFEDLKIEAQEAKVDALARLEVLMVATYKAEQEAAELQRQRAEIAAQRKADAEQKRKDDAERAERNALVQAASDAAYETLLLASDALAGAVPRPPTQTERSVDAFLCYAWGETDVPCVEIVFDRAGVQRFIVREWLGDELTTNDDDSLALPEIMARFDEHDWSDEPLRWTFEIGGVSIEKVYAWLATPPEIPAPGGEKP